MLGAHAAGCHRGLSARTSLVAAGGARHEGDRHPAHADAAPCGKPPSVARSSHLSALSPRSFRGHRHRAALLFPHPAARARARWHRSGAGLARHGPHRLLVSRRGEGNQPGRSAIWSWRTASSSWALCLLDAMPFLVEVGVLLDLFVGIFVMGIIVTTSTGNSHRSTPVAVVAEGVSSGARARPSSPASAAVASRFRPTAGPWVLPIGAAPPSRRFGHSHPRRCPLGGIASAGRSWQTRARLPQSCFSSSVRRLCARLPHVAARARQPRLLHVPAFLPTMRRSSTCPTIWA